MTTNPSAVRRRRAATAGFHLGAGTLAVLWLLPIALVLVTSVRSFDDIAAHGLGSWPHSFTLDNFRQAWVEGGPALGELLTRLGATRCGAVRSPDGRPGERWALGGGTLVVVPARGPARPRVLGVVLRGRAPREIVRYPFGGFWVRYDA